MSLPHYAKGYSFPGLGESLELSVVRAPSPLGVTYTAGLLVEGQMDPTLAMTWPSLEEHSPNLHLAQIYVSAHPDSERAAAAMLRTCVSDEEMYGVLSDDVVVPRFIFERQGQRQRERSLSTLYNFGFRESFRTDRLAISVRGLVTFLEGRYPALRDAVAIPTESPPAE